ncbi:MAG: CHASE2 domain-containing protein [Zoogloeaceae bacterium]|jgi:serine phosphatase RsbU (regulator of sigma subunit)|nr:CHASE2 domain-containing protein [Zoogloeaceae bacterium]
MPDSRLSLRFLRERLLPGGRWLALVVLLALAWFQPEVGKTPLSLLTNAQSDYTQRIAPRNREMTPAIVVAIDEKSLGALGQWPWSRQTLAELLEAINRHEPLAIGIDMIFPEADRMGPERLIRLYPRLKSVDLPDPDARFAAALAATPSVLGLAAVHDPAPEARHPRVSPVIVRGGDIEAAAEPFAGVLNNLPLLENAAQGQALLNSQADPTLWNADQGVLRRIPLVALVDGEPLASLGPEMLRLTLEAPAVEVQMRNKRIERVGVAEYQLPTLENGELFLHFGHFQADRYLSAIDVLEGRVPAENLRNRMVLVGFSALGLQDRVLTPLGEKVPGVEVHLQTLESFIQGAALTRPAWVLTLERALLVLLGMLMILFLPRARSTQAVALGLLLPVLLFALGLAFFLLKHVLFDAITLLALLLPVFLILLIGLLTGSEQQYRRTEAALQASSQAIQRISGELEAARRIQEGLLPDLERLFTGENRFQLAAVLEPAREVGGDYFDCFMLDARRLYFAVGDVSGKGMPASLFMAVAKSLAETFLRQSPDDPLGAVMQLDAALQRNNQECLFVTAFVAVLDVESGTLSYFCAGHDAPWRLRADGGLGRIPTETISGPPLGTMEAFPYQQGRLRLAPGDVLILTTDGVTEASNGEEWYGSTRLEACLRALPPTSEAAVIRDAILTNVRAFEHNTPPADDLTLLIVKWHPKG